MPKTKNQKKKKQLARAKSKVAAGNAPMTKPLTVQRLAKRLTPKPVVAGKSLRPEQAEMEKNAMHYVGLLNDPFSGRFDGVRVPDLLSWPTATMKLKTTLNAGISANVTSQHVFCPNLAGGAGAAGTTGFYQHRSDAASPGTYGAWSYAGDTINFGLLNSNTILYRTVSFGVRFIPVTDVASRAGTVRVGKSWDPNSLSTTISALGGNPNYVSVPINSDEGSDVRTTWRPGDYETGLDMHAINSTTWKGALIYEVFAGPSAQTYTFEVYHHVEYIPVPASAPLFQLASAPGNEGDIAAATSWVERAAGAVSGFLNPMLSNVMADAAASWLGQGSYQSLRPGYGGGGYLTIEEMALRAARRTAHRHEGSDALGDLADVIDGLAGRKDVDARSDAGVLISAPRAVVGRR